jgi:hypothetical protein
LSGWGCSSTRTARDTGAWVDVSFANSGPCDHVDRGSQGQTYSFRRCSRAGRDLKAPARSRDPVAARAAAVGMLGVTLASEATATLAAILVAGPGLLFDWLSYVANGGLTGIGITTPFPERRPGFLGRTIPSSPSLRCRGWSLWPTFWGPGSSYSPFLRLEEARSRTMGDSRGFAPGLAYLLAQLLVAARTGYSAAHGTGAGGSGASAPRSADYPAAVVRALVRREYGRGGPGSRTLPLHTGRVLACLPDLGEKAVEGPAMPATTRNVQGE